LQVERSEAQKTIDKFRDFLEVASVKQEMWTSHNVQRSERAQSDVFEILLHDLNEKGLSMESVWLAYWQLDPSRVHGAHETRSPCDIVSLLEYARDQGNVDAVLEPFQVKVRRNFEGWLALQRHANVNFSPTQIRWLRMMRDCIATKVRMELEDFNQEPFQSSGGLEMAIAQFGSRDQLERLVRELNGALVYP
jgi:hypothetical protein